MRNDSTRRRLEAGAARDHYADVTAQIIAALEAGTPPWRQPWDNAKTGGPMTPQNATTGAAYRGINTVVLGMSPMAFMSGDPRWATYKQAADRGWQVRKGSRGTPGFFYKRVEVTDREGGGEGSEGKWIPLLRSFALFHATQIDGIPPYVAPGVEEAPWRAPDAAEIIARNSRAVIHIGGERAFYSPTTDHIQMPPQVAFRSPAAWASVQMHELSHWTGHGTRLNRDLTGSFGSQLYAQEELKAELSQAMVCAALSIADCDFTNGAAYIATWLRKLRDDKREIFKAASDAQRIADFLLAFHPDWAQRARPQVEQGEENDAEPQSDAKPAAGPLQDAA
jgi:antirestriction protein ArdC